MTNNHCKEPIIEVTKESFKYLSKHKDQAKKIVNAICKAIINVSFGLVFACIVGAIYIIKKYF